MNKDPAGGLKAGLWITVLLGTAAFLLVAAIVSGPETAFEASLHALQLWWHIVFPALLPFLVLTEIMLASGASHGAGVLLEPLMRRVLKLPGQAGWVLVTGMTAGFPAGAQAAQTLAQQDRLSPQLTGRLASLSHFCSPMAILIVVGAGMLQDPAAGYVLLIAHWSGGLLAAWTRSRKHQSSDDIPSVPHHQHTSPLLLRAAQAAGQARARDGRSLGRLLGDSVSRSVQTLMITGGYIIIFAVLISLLQHYFPIVPGSLTSGTLELYTGAQALSHAFTGTTPTQLALLSALLAWGGLSGQLQSLSIVKERAISWRAYAGHRLLHALYAAGITLLIWKPLQGLLPPAAPAFGSIPAEYAPNGLSFSGWDSFVDLFLWQVVLGLVLVLAFSLTSRFFIQRKD
ncbi:nucleoside recognition domain protein [Paenibacillus algicola]|uniref:Nucleoside recognition domain protein n=1 Tax=Paenibacillus algicola TaxID=2565926 RepID=A0A4P8XRU7_9BACL|nr:nucleoside recognition domain-containing protein [Paenibacillus algicola]QCT03269.1 nucleoside recognition domain protein [Paenibacillus algicola]